MNRVKAMEVGWGNGPSLGAQKDQVPKKLGTQWQFVHVCREGWCRTAWGGGAEKGTSVVAEAPGQRSGPLRSPVASSAPGPSASPRPPAPHTFGAVPGGRAVALGFALLRGGGPQGLGALA